MLDFSITFVVTLVNFFILYLILKKLLFKPVTEFMDGRAERIRRDFDNASKELAEAERMKKQYEGKLAGAEDEAVAILKNARERAEAEYQEHVKKAKADVDAILERGREQLAQERIDTQKALQTYAVEIALSAAGQLLSKSADNEANRHFVRAYIDQAGKA
jgi:F-type H+-transporting ATPase subunit b